MLTIVDSHTYAAVRRHAQKILVVEDDEMNLELTTDLLESVGFKVFKAQSAEEGLGIARDSLPNLILMDICLPTMDGLTATKRLKEDPRTSHIPVVALTAYAMKGDESKAYSAGCAGYLSKPINTRSFVEVVTQLLDNSNG